MARFWSIKAKKRAEMNPVIMQALVQGSAALISAFVRLAVKSGFAIVLLIICCGGLLWYGLYIDAQRAKDKAEFRAELVEVRNEYRSELSACNKARELLAHEVNRLSVEVAVLKARTRKR